MSETPREPAEKARNGHTEKARDRRSPPPAPSPATTSAPSFADAIAHLAPEEQGRRRGILEQQASTLTDRVVDAALIRAMAMLLASPLECPTCECRLFFPAEDMPGPSCDWRTADAATFEASIAPFRPVCPLCEPSRALASIQHRYPETRP